MTRALPEAESAFATARISWPSVWRQAHTRPSVDTPAGILGGPKVSLRRAAAWSLAAHCMANLIGAGTRVLSFPAGPADALREVVGAAAQALGRMAARVWGRLLVIAPVMVEFIWAIPQRGLAQCTSSPVPPAPAAAIAGGPMPTLLTWPRQRC